MSTLLNKLIAEELSSSRQQSNERHLWDKRLRFIGELYAAGGLEFVEKATQYGRTDRGQPLDLPPWYREYLRGIGDLRISHTLTLGPSQCGKTLGHNLLNCFLLLRGGLNTFTVYDLERTLNRNVPLQFRPTLANWMTAARSRLRKSRAEKTGIQSNKTQSNSLIQVNDGNAMFGYASTSRPDRKDGTAAAGSSVISLTTDILLMDERSKFAPGASGPLTRRLDASMLPTRPIRELGTPGAGQGIEAELKNVDFHFYPHYECPHCRAQRPLDPKGCLLKPEHTTDVSGHPVTNYLTLSGRPIAKSRDDGSMDAYWHHRDRFNAIATAFFGCSECGAELSRETRTNAWFQCLQTGVKLTDFLDSLPPGVPERVYKVAFHLSPLTRDRKTNEAERLIRDGLDTANPIDWQQQGLGHPSEAGENSVPLHRLIAAIDAPNPTGNPDMVLAGIDCGRGEDWLWVCRYFLPPEHKKMKVEEVIARSVRHIVFGGDILRSEVPDRLAALNVQFGIMDNEPDRSDAARLCDRTVLEMADQKGNLADAVRRGNVKDGGEVLPCWLIRNSKFLKQVLVSFLGSDDDGEPLYRLPDSWEQWLSNVTSERSPLRHLMAPSHDPSTGEWFRGEGNVDDLYYAAMFCEAAFYIRLTAERFAHPAARRPIATRVTRRFR